jgi:hypothetical protein
MCCSEVSDRRFPPVHAHSANLLMAVQSGRCPHLDMGCIRFSYNPAFELVLIPTARCSDFSHNKCPLNTSGH